MLPVLESLAAWLLFEANTVTNKSFKPCVTDPLWLVDSPHKGQLMDTVLPCHDIAMNMMTSSNFPRYWPFVRGIHRSPVNSPHKGQWRGAFMFSLICARINHWVNTHEAGGLRCYRAHYDVIVMMKTVAVWKCVCTVYVENPGTLNNVLCIYTISACPLWLGAHWPSGCF